MEYGPVDLDTVREWRDEGRVIPHNYLRKEGETTWALAAEIADLFPRGDAAAAAVPPHLLTQERTLFEIIQETCRIYRRGFLQFVALALMVTLPLMGIELAFQHLHVREGIRLQEMPRGPLASIVLLVAVLLATWPLFVGALQFMTVEAAAGRPLALGSILRRAMEFWRRIFSVGLFVYGSFLFWTALLLVAVLAFAAQPTISTLLLTMLALIFHVYMVGRLFINFLFWQQACTLGELEGPDALRESKELARSRPDLPRLQRPLYRGAILVSIWLGMALLCSAGVEMPFLFARLQGVTTLEQGMAIMDALAKAPAPDAITIASTAVGSLVSAVLRPLLGIAFVVLYFDAKARL